MTSSRINSSLAEAAVRRRPVRRDAAVDLGDAQLHRGDAPCRSAPVVQSRCSRKLIDVQRQSVGAGCAAAPRTGGARRGERLHAGRHRAARPLSSTPVSLRSCRSSRIVDRNVDDDGVGRRDPRCGKATARANRPIAPPSPMSATRCRRRRHWAVRVRQSPLKPPQSPIQAGTLAAARHAPTAQRSTAARRPGRRRRRRSRGPASPHGRASRDDRERTRPAFAVERRLPPRENLRTSVRPAR